jgi:nitrogen fixation protein NifU and related proteins
VYSPQLLDHFEHPRNAGTLEAADVSVQVANPVCGDVLKLYARFSGYHIGELKFQAQGCAPAIACGSALTELALGKTVEEAGKIQRQEIARVLGGLPEASQHASHLAIEALTALLREFESHVARPRAGQ